MGKSKQKKLKEKVATVEKNQTTPVVKPARKKVLFNVLDSPFDIHWPEIGAEKEKAVLECLERSLVPFRKPSVAASPKELRDIPKEKRREWRVSKQAERENQGTSDKRVNQNQSLIVGLNKVTRSLEKGEPVLVIAERQCDPPLLTRFLIPLCKVKAVPLLAVRQVSALLTAKLQLPRCLCIAFRAQVKDQGNVLHEVYNKLLDICTECKLNPIVAETNNEPLVKVDDTVNKPETNMEVHNTPNFYLKKPLNGKPAFVPGQRNPLSDGPASNVKLGSDFVSLEADTEEIKNAPSALKNKIFKNMRIKRLQSNPNKFKKK